MPSLYISAAHKSSGKTTLTMALCRILQRAGLYVQAFKKGPDYIDPIWHTLAAKNPCYNLDFHMMSRDEIFRLHHDKCKNADICIIEGNKGLYDGMSPDGSDCNAELAKSLGAQVILVIDCEGITRGIAPLLLGYLNFDKDVRITGVILNKVAGKRHEEKLKEAVKQHIGLPILGSIPRNTTLSISERNLGLIPANESVDSDAHIDTIANFVEPHLDLESIIAIARNIGSEALEVDLDTEADTCIDPFTTPKVRIGIAKDRAFGFYYNEDLDNLRAKTELIEVDFFKDEALPQLDALVIGGGFPENFINELSNNKSLLASIRDNIEAGLPVYAECGGLMYLSRTISNQGITGNFAGIVPGDTVMSTKPVGRGYTVLSEITIPANKDFIPAHEFHYSKIMNLPDSCLFLYKVIRGEGITGHFDGFKYKNLLASYSHRRGTGKGGWINTFIELARNYHMNRTTPQSF